MYLMKNNRFSLFSTNLHIQQPHDAICSLNHCQKMQYKCLHQYNTHSAMHMFAFTFFDTDTATTTSPNYHCAIGSSLRQVCT